MSLIVLLILAAVSLSAVFSDKGIFSRSEESGSKYNEAKAREVLETVLLADGQYEKNLNPEYDQDEFLDELIINEIPGSRIQGDVAIIGEWAFELDRSVPKIGRGLGKADKLVFPTVEIISGPTLIENGKKATFEAKVTETTKGVSRIELWLDGKKIEKETKTYETLQKEVTVTFEVNKNGKYTVKAYADLMGKATTTVEGIIPAVSFSPNGSEDWKKQHTTKVTVEETAETITGIQYLWVKDDGVNEPDVALFTQNCPSDGIIIGGNDTMTGTYYLWILLTLGTGETQRTSMYSSQGFYFDNKGPTVNLTSTPVSETSFTLIATASDNYSGIAKYEFFIDGQLVKSYDSNEESKSFTVDYGKIGEPKCSVTVTDKCGNKSSYELNARTLLYVWDLKTYTTESIYEEQPVIKSTYLLRSAPGGLLPDNGRVDFGADRGYHCNSRVITGASSWAKDNYTQPYMISATQWWEFVSTDNVRITVLEHNCEKKDVYKEGESTGKIEMSSDPEKFPNGEVFNGYYYVRREELG